MDSVAAHRPTYARSDLDNLAFNLRSARTFIGDKTKIMAVVKANAYGHGMVECSRRLVSEGVDWLGVALPEEGVELRNAGIATPILVLGSFWTGQEETMVSAGLTPVIFSLEQASLLNAVASRKGITADYHLKIDTGMGRIGVRAEMVSAVVSEFRKLGSVRMDGVMTHFAAADDLGENEFTQEQITKFEAAVSSLRQIGFDPTYTDLANSPGAIAHPKSRRELVRLGGILYGLGGDVLPAGIEIPDLKPVLSLRSEIAQIKHVPRGETLGYGRTYATERDSVIATVPIGYADGYPRSMSNVARTIVRGQYASVVGRVSMDWTIIDVSDIADAAVGDAVTLIGRDGSLEVRAEDLALAAGTISYEITCGISTRVARATQTASKFS